MVGIGIALIILIGVWLWAIFPAVRRHRDRRWLNGATIAHRGLHDLTADMPENSLAAFREAVNAGYAIEIDIHLTADGQVVVFHDATLTRMCGAEVTIADATLRELNCYTLGTSAERIPTLQECLDTVAGQVPLLIEFKCENGETCHRLCEATNEILTRYEGAYCIQSFNPLVLRWYRRYRPDICRGQLATVQARKGALYTLLGQLLLNFLGRPDFVSYEHCYRRYFPLRVCARLGAFPVCWTIRSEEEKEAASTFFRTYIFENFIPKQ